MFGNPNMRHECPNCLRVINGPSFFRHVRQCAKQTDIVAEPAKADIQRYTISNNTLYHSTGKQVCGI